jgi:hypothetical protein
MWDLREQASTNLCQEDSLWDEANLKEIPRLAIIPTW